MTADRLGTIDLLQLARESGLLLALDVESASAARALLASFVGKLEARSASCLCEWPTDDRPPCPKHDAAPAPPPAATVTDFAVEQACAAYQGARWSGRAEVMNLADAAKHRAAIRAALTVGIAAGECQTCEPAGVFATDGTGPYDCYTCGKPADWRPFVEEVGTDGKPTGYLLFGARAAAAPTPEGEFMAQQLEVMAQEAGGSPNGGRLQDAADLIRRLTQSAPAPRAAAQADDGEAAPSEGSLAMAYIESVVADNTHKFADAMGRALCPCGKCISYRIAHQQEPRHDD